jgi:hypothetical protein
MSLEFKGKFVREGDNFRDGERVVMRVVMTKTGWTVDVEQTFGEMLTTWEDRETVGASLVEAVKETVRKLTKEGKQ